MAEPMGGGPKMVQAWQAADGSLHVVEQAAKDHDFACALAAWFRARFPDPGTDDHPGCHFHTAMLEDRMVLLPIFKLLNGGNAIALPPRSEDPQ